MGLTGCSDELSPGEYSALWGSVLVSASLSLWGASFMLLSYLQISSGRSVLSKLVALLALTDLLWSFTTMATSLSKLLTHHHADDLPWSLCVIFRFFFQFFAGASILWTSSIAVFIYLVICRDRFFARGGGSHTRMWLLFHGLCWGLPFVSLLPMIVDGEHVLVRREYVGLCFPAKVYHRAFWLYPIFFIFLGNAVLYFLILWRIRKERKNAMLPSTPAKEAAFTFTLYLLVFFFSWAFDVFETSFRWALPDCNLFFLVLTYRAFNNLQGFFDCLVYGLSNKKVRSQFFGGGYKRGIQTATIFFFAPLLLLPVLLSSFFSLLLSACRKQRRSRDPLLRISHPPSIVHDYYSDGEDAGTREVVVAQHSSYNSLTTLYQSATHLITPPSLPAASSDETTSFD
ncbi:hypothetical protein QOT17_000739 [Balamuthia mandrillaris]